MTLPLFPDPPSAPVVTPPATQVPGAIGETRRAVAPLLPLSIRDVTGLIQESLRPLAAGGRRIVHAQWLRPSMNAGARGFLSVTLADTEDNTVSIDGFIWERTDVQAVLKQGQAFGCDLSDREGRCEVMLEVTIDFWAKKAKPYLRIHGLNHVGMKGLRQQQREATLKRLEQEALLDRNKAAPWPRPTLRVFCIGKRDSDGCRDALSILQRSGFRFECTVHNVAVQGIAAVSTLVAAFTELTARQTDFDVVLLIRGGGNELDLLAYDDYLVAQAVALCPLPVVAGLGHTADYSVCDAVAFRSLETPTAAARYLVDAIQTLLDDLRHTRDRLRVSVLEQLHARRRHLLVQRPQFVRSALSLVHVRQRRRVTHWHVLVNVVRDGLHHHRHRRQASHQPIRLNARRVLQSHHTLLADRVRMVFTGAPTLVATRRHQLRLWRQALPLVGLTALVGPTRLDLRQRRQRIHHVGCEMVRRAQSRLHRLHAHIQAASPERYFALGLSYVTRADGTVVRRHADVTVGDSIDVHLVDGTVAATITRKDATHDH